MIFEHVKQPERFTAAFAVATFSLLAVVYDVATVGIFILAAVWIVLLYALALFRDWRASR